MSGAIIRHGPHHGAQKSTSTGMSDLSTSCSNVASVTTVASDPARAQFRERNPSVHHRAHSTSLARLPRVSPTLAPPSRRVTPDRELRRPRDASPSRARARVARPHRTTRTNDEYFPPSIPVPRTARRVPRARPAPSRARAPRPRDRARIRAHAPLVLVSSARATCAARVLRAREFEAHRARVATVARGCARASISPRVRVPRADTVATWTRAWDECGPTSARVRGSKGRDRSPSGGLGEGSRPVAGTARGRRSAPRAMSREIGRKRVALGEHTIEVRSSARGTRSRRDRARAED